MGGKGLREEWFIPPPLPKVLSIPLLFDKFLIEKLSSETRFPSIANQKGFFDNWSKNEKRFSLVGSESSVSLFIKSEPCYGVFLL